MPRVGVKLFYSFVQLLLSLNIQFANSQ